MHCRGYRIRPLEENRGSHQRLHLPALSAVPALECCDGAESRWLGMGQAEQSQNRVICVRLARQEQAPDSRPDSAAGPSRDGRDQRARWRAVRPSAPRKVPSTRWAGATATVSDGSPSAVGCAEGDPRKRSPTRARRSHRHGTLPSEPQIVQPVTPRRPADWPDL